MFLASRVIPSWLYCLIRTHDVLLAKLTQALPPFVKNGILYTYVRVPDRQTPLW